MRRAHESNGFASKVNIFQNCLQQFFDTPGSGLMVIVAYLMVLAVYALQVAMIEKNVADAVFARNGRLFAPVNHHAADVVLMIGLAVALLSGKSVRVAISRAQIAGAKRGKRNIHCYDRLL